MVTGREEVHGLHVALLEIEGGRGVRLARLPLKEHTVLIGANNAGKSTIVDALARLHPAEQCPTSSAVMVSRRISGDSPWATSAFDATRRATRSTRYRAEQSGLVENAVTEVHFPAQ
jgi:predicted ATP-dependent endonuclease of OLD family